MVFLLCISCSKDRALRPENPGGQLSGLLKSMALKANNIEYRYDYEYINNLLLNSITYTRENKVVQEYFKYENDTLKFSSKGDTIKKYIYENGRLKYLEKSLLNESDPVERSSFSYYVTGELFSIERRSISEFSDDFLKEITFVWSQKNVVLMKENSGNWLVEETQYQYENTPDPLYNMYFNTLRIPPDGIEGLSFNNYRESQAVFSGHHYKSTGQYNERGFPVKKTILKKAKGDEWTIFKEYSFEYYE